MAYSNKFVVCVLVNGQIQKEKSNNVVSINFGDEYSLRFRNKNSQRAVVKFYLDGENVSGNGYVVPANDFVDIERHHDKDRRFKFVELESEEAYDAGKNGPNVDGSKGLLEARFYLEKKRPIQNVEHHHHWHDTWPTLNNPYVPPPKWGTREASRTCGGPSGHVDTPLSIGNCAATPEVRDGVTVEGTMSGQTFDSVHIDLEATCTTIKVTLQGKAAKSAEQPSILIVEETVDAVYCTKCGAKRTQTANFCGKCGRKF
jgi:ribosomal protein L40E